jgi:hypothetical protein
MDKNGDFKLGVRFYAIAFLVIFYYFFTKPVRRGKALEIE